MNITISSLMFKLNSRDCHGEQFICIKCGSYDSSRYLYQEDTTHIFCWAPLPSRPVGPSWPLEQDRAVGFVRIGYKRWRNRSAGPVGPDVSVDQSQPVAEGPVGQYITRSPVGSDGMLSTCDSDQPMAEGPVGQYITRGPVGSDGMLSTCDSDQPVAGGPVVYTRPSGPKRDVIPV